MSLPVSVPLAESSRERPITTTCITATQDVILLGDRFGLWSTAEDFQIALENNDIVTSSGRTLSEILSLSHPEDLASYRIESVQNGQGGGLREVVYSRAESVADLRIGLAQITQLARSIEADFLRVSTEKAELERRLARWQTADLVVDAFNRFVWAGISGVDRDELEQQGLGNFLDLFYAARSNQHPARKLARRVLDRLDPSLRWLAQRLVDEKRDASSERPSLAHPNISAAELKKFLEEIDDQPDAVVMAAFDHIERTASTNPNIQEANHRVN